MTPPSQVVPRAFYRLQLNDKFTFSELENIVDYLAQLGISDVYLSPIFLAHPGSTHGYDVHDPSRINPELGGFEGLLTLSTRLQEKQLGLLLDFVPNHMGILGSGNWRWLDVLENGEGSRFAEYFDIEWKPRESTLLHRVLVPILHDFYGRVLEAGEIHLQYDQGRFSVVYRGQTFPLRLESYGAILERLSWQYEPGSSACSRLEDICRQFKAMAKIKTSAADWTSRRDALRESLSKLIHDENLSAGLNRVFKNINGTVGQPSSFDSLHEVLEGQHYRLSYWKLASHEINYRRFFAIDTLVGLKIENEKVFADCHEMVQHLFSKNLISGLRIDHIDGLWDPKGYLDRLRLLAMHEQASFYLVVEKILAPGELVPPDWPVHGTTGYEFSADVFDVLSNSDHALELTAVYESFTGTERNPDDMMHDLKLYIMEELFPNSLDNLSTALVNQVKSDRYWRDFAVNELRDALKNIIACLPVYRTYRRKGGLLSEQDGQFLKEAVGAALKRNKTQDPTPYEFIQTIWTGSYPPAEESGNEHAWADEWVSKLQQITGAITAKSIEDTFFYRYARLLGANEVGHDPREGGSTVQAFHEANMKRQSASPYCMLSTSTHDTKMGEDCRARLLVLTEIPEEWRFLTQYWKSLNEGSKTRVGDALAPDANEEYLLYQALLGAWPIEGNVSSADFINRIKNYFQKAISEAKFNTNWNYPNEPWCKACERFVETILQSGSDGAFLASFTSFAEKIAERGMLNSLAQLVLKVTCPGIPDIYQGSELWNFSLVDPDNRRPVDYSVRKEVLANLPDKVVEDLLRNWKDGEIKMFLIQKLLQLRAEIPLVFTGSYTPVAVFGTYARNVVSFLRGSVGMQVLVVIPRFCSEVGLPPLGEAWKDTELELPRSGLNCHNVLTSERLVSNTNGRISMASVTKQLPVGVFKISP